MNNPNITQVERIYRRNEAKGSAGNVLCLLNRDFRLLNNWAVHYAQELTKQYQESEVVLLCLFNPKTFSAPLRQFHFIIEGLKELHAESKMLGIPLLVEAGPSPGVIKNVVEKFKITHIVSDFSPLREMQRRGENIVKAFPKIPFDEVDAHNIVPCRKASSKLEFGAYTLRPKINKLLKKFLIPIPAPKYQSTKFTDDLNKAIHWESLYNQLQIDQSVQLINCSAGEKAASKVLDHFIQNGGNYDVERNNPNLDALSHLSPYIRNGQISCQYIALKVSNSILPKATQETFLEELIIRKELSDNYCLYNPNYDTIEGLPEWAKRTLLDHWGDSREYVYSLKQFETAATHEALWNAAQKQLLHTGKMHGYMRMYWAKKILEWSDNPETALQTAIYLNDKYSLDGFCPNGFVGCAWAIGGVHDRAWKERPVYGKIRYMNENGCKRKFDTSAYIKRHTSPSLF